MCHDKQLLECVVIIKPRLNGFQGKKLFLFVNYTKMQVTSIYHPNDTVSTLPCVPFCDLYAFRGNKASYNIYIYNL